MFLPLSLVLIALNSFCGQFEIPQQHIMASQNLGEIKLYHKHDGFFVHASDGEHKISKYWMNPELRTMDKKKLKAFLSQGKGYIEVKKLDNNEYALRAKVRGLGGGPVSGLIAYWTVKGAAYVGICAGTAVAVGAAAGTLPVSGAIVGGAGGLASAGLAISAPAGVTATLVGGAAAGTATMTGTALAAGIQATATIAATAAAVETASTSVGLFFLSIPILP